MLSRSIVVAALVAACVAAAAGGFYASRQEGQGDRDALVASGPGGSPAAGPEHAQPGHPKGVAETETLVTPPAAPDAPPVSAARTPVAPSVSESTPVWEPGLVGSLPPSPTPARQSRSTADRPRTARTPRPAGIEASRPDSAERPEASSRERQETSSRANASASVPAPGASPTVTRPPAQEPSSPEPVAVSTVPDSSATEPRLEQIVIPSSSVIGLRVETPLSTERTRVEDRVEARVTRDVVADGRVAVPAGTRAIGSVVLVEPGGKMRDRARLGVRFHTLLLDDGTELPVTTEAMYREGDSPSTESTRKIGGAAIGGAILGAIIGGKKGAIVGSATGAAGGAAVVMAGDRNAATLPAGTIVTIRLAAPVEVEVEKR